MNITVLFFASLAEKAQQGQQQLSVEGKLSLPELYAKLTQDHGFTLEPAKLRVAINDEFASWDDVINDGDTIAFIPPVAGG